MEAPNYGFDFPPLGQDHNIRSESNYRRMIPGLKIHSEEMESIAPISKGTSTVIIGFAHFGLGSSPF
jgi:hypothetical protein